MLCQCKSVPLLSGDCSHQELLGIAEGIGFRSPNTSGDLGPDSKPVESSRTLSAETIGLEIGPKRDGILGGRALNFACVQK